MFGERRDFLVFTRATVLGRSPGPEAHSRLHADNRCIWHKKKNRFSNICSMVVARGDVRELPTVVVLSSQGYHMLTGEQ